MIKSLTDQDKLERANVELVVVKEMPKLESEYGDQCTRPPDNLKHRDQVLMSVFQGALRELRSILLLSCNGLVRPPEHSTWFMHGFGDPTLQYDQHEQAIHTDIPMAQACVWNKWRETHSEAAGSDTNKAEKLLALGAACSELHLRHVKGLQQFVFRPGEEMCVCKNRNQFVVKRARSLVFNDHGSIISQGSDLRTNPFKGRGDGAILIRHKVNGLKPMYGSVISLIMVQLNGQFQGLIGMIYEVLDREKDERLDTVLFHLFVSACSWGSREELEQETIEAGSEHGDQSAGSSWYGEHSDQEKKQVGSASTIRWHASLMEDALASQLDQSQDQRPRLKDKLFSALLWRDSAGERDNLQRK